MEFDNSTELECRILNFLEKDGKAETSGYVEVDVESYCPDTNPNINMAEDMERPPDITIAL